MASPEIIGLLCAGSTMFHSSAGVRPADALSRAELAGLLAGAGPLAMNLALAKYAGDVDAERLLVAGVRVWAAGLASAEGWRIVRGRPTVSNMAALAVFEVVRPNRCGRCGGAGFRSGRVCPSCQGVGVRALSGRQVAEATGVDECNYRRVWKSRYERCLSYVTGLDSDVCRLLRVADRRENLAGFEKVVDNRRKSSV